MTRTSPLIFWQICLLVGANCALLAQAPSTAPAEPPKQGWLLRPKVRGWNPQVSPSSLCIIGAALGQVRL